MDTHTHTHTHTYIIYIISFIGILRNAVSEDRDGQVLRVREDSDQARRFASLECFARQRIR